MEHISVKKCMAVLAALIIVASVKAQAQDYISWKEPKFYKNDPAGRVEITEIGLVQGDISAEMELSNDSDHPAHLMMVMGLYNGKKLEKVAFSQVPLSSRETKTENVSFSIADAVNGKHLKLFLWDDKCKPVTMTRALLAKQGEIYYVSPDGNDNADGNFENPWKSVKKAALARGGSLVVLEDGDYYETDSTYFTSNGTKNAPIIIQARNKHRAKLVYPESARLKAKMVIAPEQGYITIKDLYFTQLSMAQDTDTTKTADMFLQCRGNNCNFIGNRFEGAYEEAIKLSRGAVRILIDGNIIRNMNHEGIDSLNSLEVIIRNNHITEVGRVGIMVKGGARNNVVYNNYISNNVRTMSTSAITIGGETNNTSPYDIKINTGFEAYHCIFYNNIIYSEQPGLINTGLSYMGALNCHSYNNIVIGTKYAVRVRNPSGLKNGWEWDPPTVNPVLKNNIFANCTLNSYEFTNQPQNMISDYNLFYNLPQVPTEPNSVYADPLFEEMGVNWRLKANSPAKGAGVFIPIEIDGFDGTKIILDPVDFEGLTRSLPWDMGAY